MGMISSIKAIQILDSRGNPTVEAVVELESGHIGRASVPSGASTGSKEAVELRDGNQSEYLGKSVHQAVTNINTEIQDALLGQNVTDQVTVDNTMIKLDGTDNKSRLGANALLAVSLASAHAAASYNEKELFQYLSNGNYSFPLPMMNILNGGEHADNNIDIQEFMILPVQFEEFNEALQAGVEIFHALKSVLKQEGLSTAVGDEGGFAPNLPSNHAALETILEAIHKAGFNAGSDIYLGLDVASTEFYRENKYHFSSENKFFDSGEFVDYLEQLVANYPIISIEDGMAEDDWEGWKELTKRLGNKCQLVGDDLFVTNQAILKDGINNMVANSILIKPNQIGTLTETFAAVDLAVANHYTTIISHRSGETSDSTIADISLSSNISQIKTGSLCRSDRIEKYNQLLRIESILGEQSNYLGAKAFAPILDL
ncbi:MAG: phosphopyruvate hydratase [Gammaproteobacteria bacterium]|nr:phosphopyruvate hydratase [Gammaproteobacteria bacterium]